MNDLMKNELRMVFNFRNWYFKFEIVLEELSMHFMKKRSAPFQKKKIFIFE